LGHVGFFFVSAHARLGGKLPPTGLVERLDWLWNFLYLFLKKSYFEMIIYDGLISNYLAEALRLYGSRLTAYERLEIEHYPEIWFLGLDARKIHGEEGAPQNGGYDDENGSYHKVKN
jgi:hypothetical protein